MRFFDLNANKQIKAIVGHTDSIASLMFLYKGSSNQYTLISGGHDGAIRAWDMRTYQCIFDVPAHRRKYDEGVLSLASCEKYPLIASGNYNLFSYCRWS